MITFEIDGEEYTVHISTVPVPASLPFTTPEGVTYWMGTPSVVS